MDQTDEYYFRSTFSGNIVGNLVGLTMWYDLNCPECGANNRTSMRLTHNQLRAQNRKGIVKCKKCKKNNEFIMYFGINIFD